MGDPLGGRILCHINLAKGYRGGERQAELLIRELAAQGTRQHLVIRPGNPLRQRCNSVDGLSVSEASGRSLGAAWLARSCDLLHAHEAQAFYAAALANLAFAKPYVLTRRVPNPQRPSWARRTTYGRAGRLVGVSAAVADNVHQLYPDIDVAVVPDAHAGLRAASAEVARIREQYSGKTLIGHIGALDDSHKGQRTLLATARLAVVDRPHWHFLLCGDGKDEDALKAEASDLPNVSFTGFVDNAGDYLASFDVFAFPSNFEALGSSLLDAMHFGLPVVATNIGGIPEIVEDGVNGWLIEPGDASALFDRLDRVLTHADERAAMATANREKSGQYGAAAMAEAYVEIYREVCGAGGNFVTY
jgi:glycosyltransferase involved in cell wall biosynthesis